MHYGLRKFLDWKLLIYFLAFFILRIYRLDSLNKHYPGQVSELKKATVKFEEKIYSVALSLVYLFLPLSMFWCSCFIWRLICFVISWWFSCFLLWQEDYWRKISAKLLAINNRNQNTGDGSLATDPPSSRRNALVASKDVFAYQLMEFWIVILWLLCSWCIYVTMK